MNSHLLDFDRFLLILFAVLLLRVSWRLYSPSLRRRWKRVKARLPRRWKPRSPKDCPHCCQGLSLESRPIQREVEPYPERKSTRGRKKEIPTAGFACQMAVREMHGLPEAPVQRSLLVEVGTKDGGTFYFGDALTAYILRPPQQGLSILTFVASALLKLGEPVFDIKPIFERTAQQVGSPTYGRPTVAAAHLPLNHPIDLLWKYWHVVRATLVLNNLKPTVWPLALARCIHVLMVEHTRLLTPGIAGRLAMETAISMSHIAPSKIPHAWFFEGPRIEGSPASDLRSAEYLYIPESQLY